MESTDLRPTDDHKWEQRLLPLLVVAFGIAIGATLAESGVRPMRFGTERSAHGVDAPSLFPFVHSVKPIAKGPMVAVQIADVVPANGESESVVLLMDGTSEHVVPLFVDANEGDVLNHQLHPDGSADGTTKSPGLVRLTATALGADVERIEIADRAGSGYVGEVVLKRGNTEVGISANVDDALTLAAANGSPVYIPKHMIAARGIDRAVIKKGPGGFPSKLPDPLRL